MNLGKYPYDTFAIVTIYVHKERTEITNCKI